MSVSQYKGSLLDEKGIYIGEWRDLSLSRKVISALMLILVLSLTITLWSQQSKQIASRPEDVSFLQKFVDIFLLIYCGALPFLVAHFLNRSKRFNRWLANEGPPQKKEQNLEDHQL